MKVTLVVNHITKNIETNFENMVNSVHKCPDDTDLVLFPEAAVTGLVNNDDLLHDLPLGVSIPGELINTLSEIARERKIHIGTGILEKEENKIYDAAILITPAGKIVLKYRRMTSGWYGKKATPKIYCKGDELKKAMTSLGTFAFLICGDLFSDELIVQIQKIRPDWILFPFARCFEDGDYDQKRWDVEKREYIERVKLADRTTLMVNHLADKKLDGGSFGGAMVVSPVEQIIAKMPIGKEGMLHVEI